MFESKYNKTLTIVLIVIIIAIVVLIGFLTFDFIKKSNTTKQASEFVNNFESDISRTNTSTKNVIENVKLETGNEIIESNIDTSSTSGTKKTYQGFTVAGTIKIPSINLEYPIVEEVSAKSLETAIVKLYPSTDSLNEPVNTVLIGHNYRNGLFFSNLKKLSNGAKVHIKDFTGRTVSYEVYNIFQAASTDVSFYDRDTNGLAEITLSTCTDANDDQRTIVFARQIQ